MTRHQIALADALRDRVDETAAIRTRGACRDVPTAIFFPPRPPSPGRKGKAGQPDPYAQARRICAHCPVREPCAHFALAGNEQHGLWGGMSPDERATERARRRQEAM